MILLIDTSSHEKTAVGLISDAGALVCSKCQASHFTQAEKLLPLIDNLLNNNKIKCQDLAGISVVLGPGGFTSLRIGVVTANIMAYALNIPVVGFKTREFKHYQDLAKKTPNKLRQVKSDSIVVPYYGQEPKITKAKPKQFLGG